jgi:acyl carrier protein phosphodiesterase
MLKHGFDYLQYRFNRFLSKKWNDIELQKKLQSLILNKESDRKRITKKKYPEAFELINSLLSSVFKLHK